MTENTYTQLAVIGGGPGGYVAAFLAADLGLDVTLIDLEKNPGGVCLYRGCIPSKALLHVAKLLTEVKHATKWGIDFGTPKINLDKLRSWKVGVVNQLTEGLGLLSKQRKIRYIQGQAKLRDATSVEIDVVHGEKKVLAFETGIIATGSRPITIPSLALNSPRVLNSTSALAIEHIPKTLLVVGGGYIGLELGSVYAALGSDVTIVEMLSRLLPEADRDLVKVLQKKLKSHFKDIMLNTTVSNMVEVENGVKVTFEGKKVMETEQIFDNVLVSVGRMPNSKEIGLENTNVKVDERGFIKVNAQRRTGEPTLYAIGDVAGEPMLAHKASHEGRVAVESIVGHSVAFEPKAIPAVIFTDPELAWCGLTEKEAKQKGIKVKSVRFPWGASGRATTIDRPDGLTKLIIDPETESVLGMGIVGVGAGELIAEGVLAIEMEAVVKDIAYAIHAHPTLSETIMESADIFFGTSTHVYRPKRR